MLDGMRKASQGTIGKLIMTIVMGLIIVSFVIWGVGDMLRGFSSNTVAKVGSTSITAQQYSNELQTALYRLQRQVRQPLTPAQARAFGLNAQVLDQMVDEAALNEQARNLGMAMSDQAIAEAARNDPRMKGANGQFDRSRLDQVMRDMGLDERGFIASQRAGYLRQQLEYSLVDGIGAPKALVEALQATKTETRDIAYFTLPPKAAGDIPPPSDETLKTFFNERKAAWRAPEYRSFDALLVSPESIAKPGDVSDAEARAQYDKDKDGKYTVAEKRKLQQIVFTNEGEAQAADAKIKGGATFDDIAKERKLTATDLDIGETTKANAFDPAIGEAAFALPQGGTSGPVKGPFGYTLVHVVSITPGSVKSFEDAEADVKKGIAAAKASDQVQSLHDKIEDAKASGKSVAEAAKSVGLDARSYSAVDREGNTAAGASADVIDKEQLLPAVFASDVGVDDEAIQTKDHGYIWFAVTKIDPAHDRAFEEVKDKVAEAWKKEETAKRLADAAAEMVKKLNAGGDLSDLASGVNAEAKTAKDVKRSGGADLAPNVVSAVFGVGPTGAGSVSTADGRLVFKVTADSLPPPAAGDPNAMGVSDKLKGDLSRSLVEQYVEAVKKQIGVKIDQQVLQSAEGG